jgi:hypothetical protein
MSIIKAAVAIIIAAVTMIIASFFALVIIVMHGVIRVRNSSDILLMLLVNLFGIGILVGRLQHLVDRSRWLLVELGA